MIIITIRTDRPEAEVGLIRDGQPLAYKKWQAHRELSATLLRQMHSLLLQQKLDWPDIQGIAVYQGPGSFTGLRIGLSVGNALAQGLNVPIVGTSGSSWQLTGVDQLLVGRDNKVVVPEYGTAPHVTKPRK